MTIDIGAELSVTCEKVVLGGEAIARVDGEVVFVVGGLPGELLRVRVTGRSRGRVTAELVEVVTPHPQRQAPPCPWYDRCGGCDFQYVPVTVQRDIKRGMLIEALQRGARLSLQPADIAIIGGDEWRYRARVRFAVGGADGAPPVVGFRQRHGHEIVPIDDCIVAPAGAVALARATVDSGPDATDDISVVAGTDGWSASAASDPQKTARYTIDGVDLTFAVGGFAQSNPGLLAPLGDLLAEAVGGVGPELLVDLYAGAGHLATLALARMASVMDEARATPRLLCVEADRVSAALIHDNVQRVAADARVEVVSRPVSRALGSIRRAVTGTSTVVIADPPRAGLDRRLVNLLVATPVARIAYLSCNPATLARDLAILAPRYRVRSVHLLDFFPQTSHIETLVVLDAVEGERAGRASGAPDASGARDAPDAAGGEDTR